MISLPPPERSIGYCFRDFMWCRFISRPCNGWRAGPESRIPHERRSSGICRKRGGRRTSNLEALAMILGEINRASGITTTLDDLFRRAGVRHPDALALADPPNRASFTDGPPRTLRYAQADHAISALAARLRGLGLQTGAVVAIQLPNTVESVIAYLAILRAAMIAAPLPLLWGRRDLVDALGRVSAKAILTCADAGGASPADVAIHTAAALFPIRHICGFGQDLPDGVVSIDDIFARDGAHSATLPRCPDSAASHLAAITFDMDARGANPVARNHIEVISGGLAIFLELGTTLDTCLLSAIPVSSFAG